MRRILILIAVMLPVVLNAQSDIDALRYSTLNAIGTARYSGAGGAFGALGGDFTTLSVNPAGIGVYRSNELLFTPNVFVPITKSSFLGQSNEDSKLNFNISNLGIVFTNNFTDDKNARKTSGWISSNFGIGYNRLANFNSQVYFSGFNSENSLLDRYVEIANGTAPSSLYGTYPYSAGLAYDAYLIDPVPGDTMQFMSKVRNGGVTQIKDIETKGAYDEFVLSFGGNYNNRLFLGATLGVPTVNYTESATYQELDQFDSIPDFKAFSQFDYLNVDGIGVNLKLGAIYMISNNFRLGAALHTPTYLRLNEQFYTEITPNVTVPGVDVGKVSSPEGSFQYGISTPWRAIASAAFVSPKFGFLSVDYEFVDYGTARFNMKSAQDKDFERDLNVDIDDKYGQASIIRLGGEYKYDIFRLRAGYSLMASPFNDGEALKDADISRNSFSLGAGIKEEYYFVDLGFVNSKSKDLYVPYTLNDQSETVGGAVLNRSNSMIMLTMGVRF